jgi:hypothetical protein
MLSQKRMVRHCYSIVAKILIAIRAENPIDARCHLANSLNA